MVRSGPRDRPQAAAAHCLLCLGATPRTQACNAVLRVCFVDEKHRGGRHLLRHQRSVVRHGRVNLAASSAPPRRPGISATRSPSSPRTSTSSRSATARSKCADGAVTARGVSLARSRRPLASPVSELGQRCERGACTCLLAATSLAAFRFGASCRRPDREGISPQGLAWGPHRTPQGDCPRVQAVSPTDRPRVAGMHAAPSSSDAHPFGRHEERWDPRLPRRPTYRPRPDRLRTARPRRARPARTPRRRAPRAPSAKNFAAWITLLKWRASLRFNDVARGRAMRLRSGVEPRSGFGAQAGPCRIWGASKARSGTTMSNR